MWEEPLRRLLRITVTEEAETIEPAMQAIWQRRDRERARGINQYQTLDFLTCPDKLRNGFEGDDATGGPTLHQACEF